jgi:hypothetical protein
LTARHSTRSARAAACGIHVEDIFLGDHQEDTRRFRRFAPTIRRYTKVSHFTPRHYVVDVKSGLAEYYVDHPSAHTHYLEHGIGKDFVSGL